MVRLQIKSWQMPMDVVWRPFLMLNHPSCVFIRSLLHFCLLQLLWPLSTSWELLQTRFRGTDTPQSFLEPFRRLSVIPLTLLCAQQSCRPNFFDILHLIEIQYFLAFGARRPFKILQPNPSLFTLVKLSRACLSSWFLNRHSQNIFSAWDMREVLWISL